jgi:hypothetical protein
MITKVVVVVVVNGWTSRPYHCYELWIAVASRVRRHGRVECEVDQAGWLTGYTDNFGPWTRWTIDASELSVDPGGRARCSRSRVLGRSSIRRSGRAIHLRLDGLTWLLAPDPSAMA